MSYVAGHPAGVVECPLFGSSGHLGASLQRSLGRTSFVLDVLHTAVFTSWKVAGMYSVSMIQCGVPVQRCSQRERRGEQFDTR
ncbi:hypothetical protein EVAR_88548_1 [Eumeta japonica]|uniref:Uncharacterized protein n=1 Tax=Eumeta variegata TaxID=151549 RepID=A0A4C1WLF6_EUMVA|nr:hypothetical protein EVAR_88548_1 [Eumeta japonica]